MELFHKDNTLFHKSIYNEESLLVLLVLLLLVEVLYF